MGSENARIRRTGGTLFLICLLVYATTAGGSLGSSDGVVMYELTNSFMHGSVAIPRSVLGIEAVRGPDGRTYSAFGIGQSIYNIPFYWAGMLAREGLGVRIGKPDTIPKAAVAMGGAVAAAAAVWATFLLAWRLSGSASGAVAAALILAFATSLWPYSKFGFNAPLAMTLLALATYAMLVGIRDGRERMQWWAGALFAAAYLTRHELALAAAVACVFIAIESRGDRRLLVSRARRFLPGMIVAVALQMFYNVIRFGNPLDTGHLRDSVPGFGSSVFAGLGGLLLSPGASLFLYSPPALLGVIALAVLWKRDGPAGWLLGGQVALLLLLFATLGNWMGGRSYGPRYLVPLLPFLCAPLAVWPGWPEDAAATAGRFNGTRGGPGGRRILVATFVIGMFVQLPGVLVDFSKVSVDVARRTDRRPTVGYSWETAPLALNARAAAGAVPANVRYVLGLDTPPSVRRTSVAGDRDFAQQLGFSLDFWWLYLFYLGAIPAGAAIAAGIVPLAAVAVLVTRLRGDQARAPAKASPPLRRSGPTRT